MFCCTLWGHALWSSLPLHDLLFQDDPVGTSVVFWTSRRLLTLVEAFATVSSETISTASDSPQQWQFAAQCNRNNASGARARPDSQAPQNLTSWRVSLKHTKHPTIIRVLPSHGKRFCYDMDPRSPNSFPLCFDLHVQGKLWYSLPNLCFLISLKSILTWGCLGFRSAHPWRCQPATENLRTLTAEEFPTELVCFFC